MKLIGFITFLSAVSYSLQNNCLSRDYGNGGTVCVCNSEHCDTLESISKISESNYLKVTSNKAGIRFEKEEGKFENSNSDTPILIELGTKTYQKIFGFGGAFTDSTGINLQTLSKELEDAALKSYYSKEGLEYNVGRVPIAATDFSIDKYSYDDTLDNTPDPDLKQFSLKPIDLNNKIHFVKKALNLTNGNLRLFCSAWTAPDWMRTVPGFSARESYIKEEYYQPWANYFVRFLEEYKKEGVDFWGITTGNEPRTAFLLDAKIPSVAWDPPQMLKWIKENLGPAIRNSSLPDTKILFWDDQTNLLPDWPIQVFSDETVRNYVDGIAIHWYGDSDRTPDNLDKTHSLFPEKFILATEACNGYDDNKVFLGSWDRGEKYAKSVIRDLNHWVIGWVDWNMALNLQGGPTNIGNFLDSPIIVNATAGEFYKQPTYYTLGHFSKFIPRDSSRIDFSLSSDDVDVTAVKRPDNGTVVVILNTQTNKVPVSIKDPERGYINLEVTPKSITSIVYW